MVKSIAPGILFTGMTIIGYGLSTNRKWAISNFIKPSTQLSVMLMLMCADHSSTYWDHSRVSNEEYCLTSMLTGDKYDDAKGRMVFGALAAVLTAVSAYGIKSGSISLSATGIPFATMMGYLAWSPQTFQSCKNNAIVTGLLAFGLDIMTFVGILEVLFSASGNTDKSWYTPTVTYSVIISALSVALIGRYSDYGERIKSGSCEIDDEKDIEEEKLVDRKPELYTGILLSIVSVAYFIYLKLNFSEVSCCATYPVLIYLLFDILAKLQVWKRGQPLTGDALHRSIVYVLVQTMDVLLSSSSLISVMMDKGIVAKTLTQGSPMGIVKHIGHFAGGSLTYLYYVINLVITLVTGSGAPASLGSLKRLAEITKTLGLNVVANVVPLYVDQMNATYMMSASPQNDLNVPCYVE